MQTFRWTPEHVAAIARAPHPTAPVFAPRHAPRIAPDLDIWDHWPALTPDGALATVDEGLLVVALSAPVFDDPEERHAHARLRLFHRTAHRWRDLGPLLPDGLSPGSREWAGSMLLDAEQRRLTLYFTAAGRRGEGTTSFDQRLFGCTVGLASDLRPASWTIPHELVRPDGATYETDLTGGGGVGTIKAFRDPFHFRDLDGDVLLFAASRAHAGDTWNGLIGTARRDGAGWRLDRPLVDAAGVNNELERPHAVRHAGRTYLFWSTQRKVFAPGLRHAPTGLYGVVADRPPGPWRPINGDGLVFGNPQDAPAQAYSWQVLPNLSVWSFADLIGLDRPARTPEEARRAFAGAPAPVLRLALDDDRARLI